MSITALPPALPCTLEALEALESIEALRGDWWSLWRRAHATPFESPAWLIPWWKHIGRGALASVAVRDRGELIGLAPLYIWQDDHGTRHLFPLGIATTDHFDVLALPGREDEVSQAVAQHLARIADQWDVFEAPQLPSGATLLRCRFPKQWNRELRACESHPVLALPTAAPRSRARAIAYSHRRAQPCGGLSFEMAEESNLQALLDALASLHAQRWRARGLPGVLGEPGVLDWHREAAPQLLREGLLRLLALRFEGRVIAVALGMADAHEVPRRVKVTRSPRPA